MNPVIHFLNLHGILIILPFMVLQGIQTGEVSMVIGTHSLIADSVEFSALRIAVVDEQHRFGVIQRGRLNSKVVHIFRI